MWVTRIHYETLLENLTSLRASDVELRTRLASMQATQDWLTTHVNRLEAERRVLTEARLGLVLSQPVIERREPDEPTPPVDPGSMHGTPHDALPLAQLMAASMEDVGDEQAAMLGASHDAHGNLVYTR